MRASGVLAPVLHAPLLSLRWFVTVVLTAAIALAATLAMAATHARLRSQGTHKSDAVVEYYWPRARGDVGRYAVTPLVGPSNLQASLSWSWHHPEGRYHTVVVGGPLIDDKFNLYIASEDGVRKFSQDGTNLWYYQPHGHVVTCPSLLTGAVYGNTQNGWVWAVDMETGRELWTFRKAQFIGGDTAYVEAYDGVVVTGVHAGPGGGGNMKLLGIDASNGSTLWEYHSDELLWNVMAVFPGDGSFIVMNIRGGVLKHSLHTAELLWKASPPEVSAQTFSDGGVMLGPDGTSYTCSNYMGGGQQGQHGALRAYGLKDGALLWDRFLGYPCNSWPAVTGDGRSVVVPTGSFVASPATSFKHLKTKFNKTGEQMQEFSLSLGQAELKTYGWPDKTAAIQAYDALTGEPQWSRELHPYGRLAAAGDEEGFLLRRSLHLRDQCLPAQFGAPTISGDGTVYVGRADGWLYAVDKFQKVQKFQTGAGFLHPGTSWAPGMMAVTSCDGLFVWRY